MGSVIDTSIFIAAERGRFDLDALLDELADEPVVLAALTFAELVHGARRGPDPARRADRLASAEEVLLLADVIDYDLRVARVHGNLLAELSAVGTPVGDHDLIIAATAVALGYRVITRDARSFPRIPGLTHSLR